MTANKCNSFYLSLVELQEEMSRLGSSLLEEEACPGSVRIERLQGPLQKLITAGELAACLWAARFDSQIQILRIRQVGVSARRAA
jgi:hypothetical protein